eukprot:GHRQ01030699.1.p3 GENE.GHRQ01030699.1~~GHRQ01030699.1.p3  ORF type:complete len:106 (+),score=11.69 GHRQ01030699.1:445-762(+)
MLPAFGAAASHRRDVDPSGRWRYQLAVSAVCDRDSKLAISGLSSFSSLKDQTSHLELSGEHAAQLVIPEGHRRPRHAAKVLLQDRHVVLHIPTGSCMTQHMLHCS